MGKEELDPIDRAFAEGTPIDRALEAAVREARQQHKRAGNPVAEWRDGKIHWIPPDKIDVTDER